MTKQEQRMALASLADLASAGVKVTICKSVKAPRQKMRSKSSGGYVVGGSRPGSVKAASFGL
jgi:hypothetical protein